MTLPDLITPQRGHLLTILGDLPDDEREQYTALSGCVFDPVAVADELEALIPECCVTHTWIDEDGRAYAAGGYYPVTPTTARSWMIVTRSAFADHAAELNRLAYAIGSGLLASGQASRIETWVLASRERAQRWYRRRLGLTHDATLRRYAGNGEDLAIYARFSEE